MRLLILLMSVSNLLSCAFIPIKTPVPDGPVCRGLATRPESKQVPGLGLAVLQRPNPTCMKHLGEAYCGYCVWTVSDKTQYVGNKWNHLLILKGKKKTWDTVIDEGLTMPAETQADAKAFAINICKATGGCKDQITRWRVKLDALDSVGPVFKPK